VSAGLVPRLAHFKKEHLGSEQEVICDRASCTLTTAGDRIENIDRDALALPPAHQGARRARSNDQRIARQLLISCRLAFATHPCVGAALVASTTVQLAAVLARSGTRGLDVASALARPVHQQESRFNASPGLRLLLVASPFASGSLLSGLGNRSVRVSRARPLVRKSGRNDLISSQVINDDLAILRCSQSARLSSRMPTDSPRRMSMMNSATAGACASGPTQRLAAVRPLSEAQRARGW